MDDKTFEQFFHSAKHVSLTDQEKTSGREMLRSYMMLTPRRAAAAPAARTARASRGAVGFAAFRRAASIGALMIALVLPIAGVSYAAEGALPGDVLYPVKVSITEEVRAALAPSAAAKVEWQAERAERRLTEAETLAKQGSLNVRARATAEAEFRKHAADVQKDIAKLAADPAQAQAAANVSARFEGSLDAHAKIIEAIAEDSSEANAVTDLAAAVAGEAAVAAKTGNRIERQQSAAASESRTEKRMKASVAARKDAAERKIASVRAYLDGMKEKLGAEATVQAEARLIASTAVVAEADAKADAGEYLAASVLYLKAQRQAQEAKSLIRARGELKVRVNLGEGENEHGRTEERRSDDNRDEQINRDAHQQSNPEFDNGSSDEPKEQDGDEETSPAQEHVEEQQNTRLNFGERLRLRFAR